MAVSCDCNVCICVYDLLRLLVVYSFSAWWVLAYNISPHIQERQQLLRAVREKLLHRSWLYRKTLLFIIWYSYNVYWCSKHNQNPQINARHAQGSGTLWHAGTQWKVAPLASSLRLNTRETQRCAYINIIRPFCYFDVVSIVSENQIGSSNSICLYNAWTHAI